MPDTPPIDFEQFCLVSKRNLPQATLDAIIRWGLSERQTMVLVYLYVHGRGSQMERDQLWREAASTIEAKMRQLSKRLRRFHKLSETGEYIASLRHYTKLRLSRVKSLRWP